MKKKVKRGPKPKSAQDKKSVTMFFGVRPVEANAIKIVAEQENLSVSAFVGKCVLDVVNAKSMET